MGHGERKRLDGRELYLYFLFLQNLKCWLLRVRTVRTTMFADTIWNGWIHVYKCMIHRTGGGLGRRHGLDCGRLGKV